MSRIISIGTAVPEYGIKQSAILEFMRSAYHTDTAGRKLKILSHNSGINTRYSVVPDFDGSNSEQPFFPVDKSPPNVEERITVFKQKSVQLAIKAIENSLQNLNTNIAEFAFTHLITVTCTGIYAPGIGVALIEQLNLPYDIFHTSVNFMGCNAAFPALNIANLITKDDENAKVLIVCVELCTLHFQPKDNNDNLLANTIFGDGAAAAVVVSDTAAQRQKQPGLFINGFYSMLINRGKDLMAWNINPVNYEMVLDGGIPEFIGNEVNDIMIKVGGKLNFTASTIGKWAIHPGGKKILDSMKKRLPLNDSDMQYSYKVLADYGNMSSPTILFVMKEIMQAELKLNETVFAIGFGPGLSIESAKFTYLE